MSSKPINAELLHAVKQGDLQTAQKLVQDGHSVDGACPFNLNLLHSAARSGNVELARWLVSKGLDKNAIGNDGITPLYCAMQKDDVAMMKYLITEAHVEESVCTGTNLLHLAIFMGNTKAARYLYKKRGFLICPIGATYTKMHDTLTRMMLDMKCTRTNE